MKLTPSKEEKKLKELLENSRKILLLTHSRMDHDAICSILLAYYLLKKAYPHKTFKMLSQEKEWPKYSKFKFKNINLIRNVEPEKTINISSYDLVLLFDVDEVKRCLTNFTGKTAIAIIDHHDSPSPENYQVMINEDRSSATEQVYITLKRLFPKTFKINHEISKYIYTGIFADTNRFLYSKVTSDTYEIMAEVKKINKINTEHLWKMIINMDIKSVKVLGEAIRNMKIQGNLCYSFISDTYKSKKSLTNQQVASGISDNFLSGIARYIDNIEWGFAIYPIEKNTWKVGFRSIGGTVNVEKYAKALGGGGHKAAASTNITAPNVKKAVKIVLDTIASNPS